MTAIMRVKDKNGDWIEIPALVGVSITGVSVNDSNHLIVTLSNGTTIDAGALPSGSGGGTGEAGADGVGIKSITKTGTSGLVDTYTITLTDGNTSTFTVTNGANGKDGEDGADGKNGADGAKGEDGKDGVSCTHSWNGTTLTITSASGTSSADLKGEKGADGKQGDKGEDGHTPEKGVDYFTEEDKQELIAEVKDSADAVEWKDLDFNATNVSMPTNESAVYTKTNGIVSVQGAVKLLKSLESTVSLNVGTLPEGFRPKRNVYTMRNIGGSWYRVAVNTTGAISLIHWQTNAISTTYNVYINIEFAADD